MNNLWVYILCFWACSLSGQSLYDTLKVEDLYETTETLDEIYVEEITSLPLENLVPDTLLINQQKFQPHYKDKYSSSDFVYSYERRSEKSAWDRFVEFVRNFFSVDLNPSYGSSQLISRILKVLAIIIIVFLVALLIRYIIQNDIHLIFSKKSKKLVEIHNHEQNLHEVDFDQLLITAIDQKQYRLAVRYHFLRLLKIMSEKKVIHWNPDKINQEYTQEIQSVELKNSFDYLVYVYDNIWYGEFEIDQSEFQKIQHKFNHTIQQHLS